MSKVYMVFYMILFCFLLAPNFTSVPCSHVVAKVLDCMVGFFFQCMNSAFQYARISSAFLQAVFMVNVLLV